MWERFKKAITLRLLRYGILAVISSAGATYRHWSGAVGLAAAATPVPSATPAPATPPPSPLQAEYADLTAARSKLDVNDQAAVTSFNEKVAKYVADRDAVAKQFATPAPVATPAPTPNPAPATPTPTARKKPRK